MSDTPDYRPTQDQFDEAIKTLADLTKNGSDDGIKLQAASTILRYSRD